VEVPVTVYRDRSAHWRHAQLAACSARELKHLLNQAHAQRSPYFVVVLHGSELLTRDKTRADPVMLRRFDALLAFLQRHGNRFRTVGFADIARELCIAPVSTHAHDLRTPLWMTTLRMIEQASRPG
jgi:peptidoglycan/xylan/chitin deacetylase (PgdA/CDA1 family)